MTIIYRSANDLPPPDLAALFTDSFTGYIGGEVHMDRAILATFLAQTAVDLNLSQVAWRDEIPVAFGLIARQGWTSRLAVMGVSQAAQGQQVGKGLLNHLIEGAKSRGDHHLTLEVFEQNTRAVVLYERCGFRVMRRLYGYQAENMSGEPSDGLTEIDIAEVGRQIIMHGQADLAWQVSGTHIMRSGMPTRAYRLGDAAAVISDPSRDAIAVRALIVPTPLRHQGQGSRLLPALFAAFPAKRWIVQPICPEEYSGFLERRGFTRQALNQFQMMLDLAE